MIEVHFCRYFPPRELYIIRFQPSLHLQCWNPESTPADSLNSAICTEKSPLHEESPALFVRPVGGGSLYRAAPTTTIRASLPSQCLIPESSPSRLPQFCDLQGDVRIARGALGIVCKACRRGFTIPCSPHHDNPGFSAFAMLESRIYAQQTPSILRFALRSPHSMGGSRH